MAEAEETTESAEIPQPKNCPLCGSTKICKDGIRYLTDGSNIQRFLCKICGYRFSETRLNNPEQYQQVHKIHTKSLNCPKTLSYNRQGSNEAPSRASTVHGGLVKALTEVETRQEMPQREGASQLTSHKIVDFIWYMKRNGYAEATIQGRVRLI
ncbi:MAG: transposase, partial [Candidatus Bathyarchaeales archaeon]